MNILKNFDSGNIVIESMDSIKDIRLQIATDTNADFKQWFHFRVISEANKEHRFVITNVNDCSYKEGWEGYHAVASYDRETWFRVPTEYDGKVLTITHTPEFESIYYAYFAPYSFERHQNLVHEAQLSPICTLSVPGTTVDGRSFDLLKCSDGNNNNKKIAWVIARQHPGETMAEWCAEGLISRLLDDSDPVSRTLLENWDFYLVPNMNPDGAFRGHLRSNSAGANLNREWMNPTLDKSPEVYYVVDRMKKTGCDLFLDLHGDEAIPYTFVAGSEGVPSYNDEMAKLENLFKTELCKASPDFQTEHGYPESKPGEGNLSMASNWVGENFKCLSFTLEMPFKDHLYLEDKDFGWSPERSINLGAALLTAIHSTFYTD